MPSESSIERLAALGRLWGKIKLFHPHLTMRDIDWDAALVGILPKVRAAATTQEYRAAIEELLEVLQDPQTRCSVTESPQRSSSPPKSEDAFNEGAPTELFRIVDQALVLNCFKLAEVVGEHGLAGVDRSSPAVAEAIKTATAIVFDCRARPRGYEIDAHHYFYTLNMLIQGQLATLIDGTITLGTLRMLEHSGWPADSGLISGGYGGMLATIIPKSLTGDGRGRPCPRLAVVIDDRTPDLRQLWSGLQCAGLCLIVYEGDEEKAVQEDGIDLELTDGIKVHLRTTEFVNPDGRTGWRPDILVPSAGATGDDALAAALAALSQPKRPPFGKNSDAQAFPRGRLEKRYADMVFPDADHRLLALFRFWTVIEHFFPYTHLIDGGWSPILAEFIPKFEGNQSAIDYQMTIFELAARLADSHVWVTGAVALEEHFGAFAPSLAVGMVEGVTVILAVKDEARKSGLEVGDVVVAVDGEPAGERRTRLGRLRAASTPQARERVVNRQLLRGAKDRPARITIRDGAGREREVEAARSMRWGLAAALPLRTMPAVFEVLPSGFGYIDLDRLTFLEADKAMAAVAGTPALILDIRGYPKGAGFDVGTRLTAGNDRIATATFRRPYWRGDMIADVEVPSLDHAFVQFMPPSDKPRYRRKVVVLINEQAQSHSEHTCLLIAAATDVTFIGSATAGANGDITNVALPGNLFVSFTGHDVRHPDGRQLQRVGIQPHILVSPTIAGVRAGRDEVLEAAVQHLQGWQGPG